MPDKTVKNVREIVVGNVDNELYIIASNQNESIELCHIKSGYHYGDSCKFSPPAILSTGDYMLIFVGINWGGPSGFQVTIKGDTDLSIGLEESTDSKAVGVYWRDVVNISVTSG